MTSSSDLKVVAADLDEELIANLRLDPTHVEAAVKVPITLKVRKPGPQEFIRVHPSIELPVQAISLEDDRDGLYVVAAAMMSALAEEAKAFCLRPYITRTNVLRLWPLRLSDTDGRSANEWNRSAMVCASLAVRKWVKVKSNREAGAYEAFEAANQPPEPEWPELTLGDMLRLAFSSQGRVIDNTDHPVVKMLLGRL